MPCRLIDNLLGRFDLTEVLFIATDVLLHGSGKTLRVLRRKNYPRADLGPWRLGLDKDQVDNELRFVMVNDSKIDVSTLCDVFIKLYLEFDFLRFFFFHDITLPFKIVFQWQNVAIDPTRVRISSIFPGINFQTMTSAKLVQNRQLLEQKNPGEFHGTNIIDCRRLKRFELRVT